MPSIRQNPSPARLVTAFSALGDFLTEPACCHCEVLEICLKRLREDASDHKSSYPTTLLKSLHQVVPFTYVHRRLPCLRCVPAEILATYLTPGEELPRYGREDLPALSWTEGEQDIHW